MKEVNLGYVNVSLNEPRDVVTLEFSVPNTEDKTLTTKTRFTLGVEYAQELNESLDFLLKRIK